MISWQDFNCVFIDSTCESVKENNIWQHDRTETVFTDGACDCVKVISIR